MATTVEKRGSVFQVLNRDINLLKDENRSIRRKSLENIQEIASFEHIAADSPEFQAAVLQLYKPLLNVLSDPVERCRELSADTLLKFVNHAERPEEFLNYLIPVFVGRLGLPDILEPSEEIRLLLVQILSTAVRRSTQDLSPYLNDIVTILIRTIADPFHQVKKESCACVINLSVALPNTFHLQAESLVPPLLVALTHQHAKVRCASIEAIGVAVESGNNEAINKVVSHLCQRLFDQSSQVRLSVAKVTGLWLSELEERYTYFPKILPLHLTNLSDDVPEVRNLSWQLWIEAGEKYQRENEDQIKDLIDFPKPPPDHYPSGVTRPSFGCRHLAQKHLHQILPAVLNDTNDWVDSTRVKALSLLYQLILHAEEKVSRYLEKVISALAHAADDEEKAVVLLAESCSELLGYFVRPDIWCETFLPIITAAPNSGNLLVLSGMLSKSNKTEMMDFVHRVVVTLSKPDVCYTTQPAEQFNLVKCIAGLLNTCEELCRRSSFYIFFVLISVDSLVMEKDSMIKDKIEACLQDLSKISSQELAKNTLYNFHLKRTLQILKENHTLWGVLSPEKQIFSTLIKNGGSALADNLGLIVPIFVANLETSKEPELKLKFLTLLSGLLLQAEENMGVKAKLTPYLSAIFSEILMPNLTWHAGRTAEALRTATVTCMWALCKSCDLSIDLMLPFSRNLFTQMVSLLEDESQLTRLMTCRVLSLLLPTLVPSVEEEQLAVLLKTLVARMEDISDDVRIAVTETLEVFFSSYPNGYNVNENQEILKNIFISLLTHMDDNQSRIQHVTQDLLKSIGLLSPDLLLAEIANVRSKHRTPDRCDELIVHLKDFRI